MYCPNCGSELFEGANFCARCGTSISLLRTEYQPEGLTEDIELRIFVGGNADYYSNKWRHSKNNSGWNWAAFFGGLFWLGYRKMYGLIFSILGAFVLFDIITLFFPPGLTDALNYGIGIALSIVLGMSGNSFYLNHAKKKIRQIKNTYPNNPHAQASEIQIQGGGSAAGVFIAIGAFFLYIFLGFTIFMFLSM